MKGLKRTSSNAVLKQQATCSTFNVELPYLSCIVLVAFSACQQFCVKSTPVSASINASAIADVSHTLQHVLDKD